MRFRFQVDGAEHQIVVGADGRLVLDADRFEAKVTRSGADRLTVQVGDATYDVRVVENNEETGEYVLELAGERIPVTVADVSRGRAPTRTSIPAVARESVEVTTETPAEPVHAGGEGVRAPMPGRIVDVLVEVGDTVEAGAVVVILEAMKMENELRASRKGTVTAVLVKKGDPADGGQMLVTLE